MTTLHRREDVARVPFVTGLLVAIFAVAIAFPPPARAAASATPPAVVFLGDSLTAGFGLDPDQAYPAFIATKIETARLPFRVVNAGLSGETTAAGVRRAAWVLRQPVAVLVLALGGNDGLRGIPLAETERNLQAIIDTVRERQPAARIVIAGMESPPNMGPEFTAGFRSIFPRLAEANELPLVPFLLEGVGGEPAFNQPDGIHPNTEGQRMIADNVWRVLESELRAAMPD